MSVSITSIATYHDLIEKGIVGSQAYEIVKFIFAANKEYTNNELEYYTGIKINAVTARVNKLKTERVVNNQTILIEGQKRICSISGNKVLTVKANHAIFNNVMFDPTKVVQPGVFD